MRLSGVTLGSLLAIAFAPAACGGDAPPAKSGADGKSAASAAADAAPAEDAAAPPVASAAPPAPTPAPDPAPPPAPAPPAEDDPWQAFRQMPSSDILKTIAANQGKVHACIHAGQKRDPSESGEVKIKFVVNQKGEVLVWKDDSSSMSDEETTKCIGEALKGFKFPKQKTPGNTLGTYSLHVSG